MMLAGSSRRTIPPLGKWSREANVPGGHPIRAVELAEGEPGVRKGQ